MPGTKGPSAARFSTKRMHRMHRQAAISLNGSRIARVLRRGGVFRIRRENRGSEVRRSLLFAECRSVSTRALTAPLGSIFGLTVLRSVR